MAAFGQYSTCKAGTEGRGGDALLLHQYVCVVWCTGVCLWSIACGPVCASACSHNYSVLTLLTMYASLPFPRLSLIGVKRRPFSGCTRAACSQTGLDTYYRPCTSSISCTLASLLGIRSVAVFAAYTQEPGLGLSSRRQGWNIPSCFLTVLFRTFMQSVGQGA